LTTTCRALTSCKVVSKTNYKVGQIRLDNEAAIMAAAEREFAERGFAGASIARIAESAGVPRTNVHYYFQSKEDLYNKLLTDVVELWNQAFPQITPQDDPAEALTAYIHAKLTYSRTNPLASKIFANEILRGAPLLKNYLEDNYSVWLQGKVKVIRSWIKQGKMDPVDPLHLIFMIWSTTQHYADFDVQVKTALRKDEYSARDFEKITETVTHIILKGCGVRY
jgi:TetR/AcrR family transcriptional regulator